MPQYHFHITSEGTQQDTVDVELLDPQSAWSQAVIALGEELADCDGNLHPGQTLELIVEDENGNLLFHLLVQGRSFVS